MKKSIFCLAILCFLSLSFSITALAEPLRFYAAASLKKPLDTIISKFSQETGQKIEINYGASGGLYSQIITGQPCDLFFSADWMYLEKLAKETKLLSSSRKFLIDNLALVVAPSSQAKVKSVQDLGKEGITVAIADKRAPVGVYSMAALENLGLTKAVEKNIKAMPATVNQVAITVQEDQIDAGLIYSSVANIFSLPIVEIIDNKLSGEIVFGLGILQGKQEQVVLDFINFMEKNIAEFEKYGWKQYK